MSNNNQALDREETVQMLVKEVGLKASAIHFTCDSCDSLFHCNLAFDPYNLNGKCLLDKQIK